MTTAEVISTPAEKLESRALSLPEQARAVRIVDQPTFERAGSLLLDVANMRREIESEFAPLKQKAHEAHRAICEKEKQYLKPVSEAEAVLKSGIATYTAEQRRIEEQRRREAEEDERRRIEEEQEAAAQQAEREGASPQEVQAIIEQPVVVPRVVAPVPTFRPVAGVMTSVRWCAEVTSLRELCRAIAEGKASPELVLPNMPALNRVAVALKQTLNIPGVRAVPDTSVRAGRR